MDSVRSQNNILNEFKADFMNIVTCYQTLAKVGGNIDKTLTILQNTAKEMASFNNSVASLDKAMQDATEGNRIFQMYKELKENLKSVELEVARGEYDLGELSELVREHVWRDIHDTYGGRPDKGHTMLNAHSAWDLMCMKVAVMVLKEVKIELKKQGIEIDVKEEEE